MLVSVTVRKQVLSFTTMENINELMEMIKKQIHQQGAK